MTKQQPARDDSSPVLPKLKDWHALVVIASAVLFFFRDILLQKAFFWEDFLFQFYPFHTFAAVSLANGELPMWNPYTFNGLPFQADIQSALFYIPNLLLTFFVSGDRLSVYWHEVSVILHYILAGVFMYYLARDYGLERAFALFSGLVYALCGFMVTHAIHQIIINHVAWLPLVILLFRKALHKYSPLAMIVAGLILGHSILAGFPQMSLYIFFFLFLIFLFEFYTTYTTDGFARALRPAPLAAGVVMIAIALPALQLLPTLELAPLSQRAEITYEKSLESSMHWEQLMTMFAPNFFGRHGAQGSTFWLSNEYSLYWETCFYLGVAAVIFLVFAAPLSRTDRRIAFLFGIVFFSLLYGLGDRFVLHKLFFNYLPGFDKFRSVGRMTLLLSVAGSILAGFGLKTMLVIAQTQKRTCLKFLAGIIGVGVLLWFAVQMGFLQPSGNSVAVQQIRDIASSATTTAVVLLLVACLLVYLFLRNFLSASATVVGLIVVHVVDINLFGFEQNNGKINPDDYFRRTAQLVNYLKEDGRGEYFRVNSRKGSAMILDRNQGMVDRISLMEGYTPLLLQRTYPPGKDWDAICDLMNTKYRIVVDEEQRTMRLRQAETYLPRAFMVYQSIVLQHEDSLRAFMESYRFDPRRVVAFEEEPPYRPDTVLNAQHWSTPITSYSLNTITVQVSTPIDGFLVLSEVHYPGWNAYIDGNKERVYRANWNLRAVPVPAGTHTIEVRFEPKSFSNGILISSITLGLSIAGIVYFGMKQRKQTTAAS